MSLPQTKLASCLGYAIRLSRKTGCPKDVTDQLQGALHHLVKYIEDTSHSIAAEPAVKRRKVISLQDCLESNFKVCHASCQTEGSVLDQEEVSALVTAMGEKNITMVNARVQQFRAEIQTEMARQTRQHNRMREALELSNAQLQKEVESLALSIRSKDAHISRLEAKLESVLSPRRHSAGPAGRYDGFDAPCETAPFLTVADAAILSMTSTHHFEAHGAFSDRAFLDCG
eukprot:Skav200415  [mRNA]  locus=scaffold3090:58678:59364:+ [translate_table: standard]